MLLVARRRREEHKKVLGEIKGVEEGWMTYAKDFENTTDRMIREQPARAVNPGRCWRMGACSVCSCTLAWVLVLAALLSALQLQIQRLVNQVELQHLSGVRLPSLAPYLNSFHWFFSVAAIISILVITGAFVAARLLLGFHIYALCTYIADVLRSEFGMRCREGVNSDYYQYIKRADKYVVISDEFTKGEMKKIHKKLNQRLNLDSEKIDYTANSQYYWLSMRSATIRSSIESKISSRRFWVTTIFFFIPWLISFLCNATLIYYVFDLRYRHHHDVRAEELEDLEINPIRILQSEGFRLIGASVVVNLLSWLYIAAILSGSSTFCMLKCLYPRIMKAAVGFVNQLLAATWDDAVVDGLSPFVDEPRLSVLFIDPQDSSPACKQYSVPIPVNQSQSQPFSSPLLAYPPPPAAYAYYPTAPVSYYPPTPLPPSGRPPAPSFYPRISSPDDRPYAYEAVVGNGDTEMPEGVRRVLKSTISASHQSAPVSPLQPGLALNDDAIPVVEHRYNDDHKPAIPSLLANGSNMYLQHGSTAALSVPSDVIAARLPKTFARAGIHEAMPLRAGVKKEENGYGIWTAFACNDIEMEEHKRTIEVEGSETSTAEEVEEADKIPVERMNEEQLREEVVVLPDREASVPSRCGF